MAYNVKYAGIPLHEYLTIFNIKRTILPSRNNFTKNIPAQHGQYYMGFKYEPREITLECLVKANSKDEFIDNLREVAYILDTDAPSTLILGDAPDRYYYAIIKDSTEIEKVKHNAKFDLHFICYDPYAYAIESDLYSDRPFDKDARVIDVYNGGDTDTYPMMSVAFSQKAYFLQATNELGQTVLVGRPPNVDYEEYSFDSTVLRDSCNTMEGWYTVSDNVVDRGNVSGNLGVNTGGYGICCTNFGSGDDWHGGARRKNFTPVQDFRVTVRMEHNSQGELGWNGGTGSGSTKPPVPPTSNQKYKVTAKPSLRIRSGRGDNYKQVGSIPYGKIVTVTDIKSNWGKTSYGGKTGYIYMKYCQKYTKTRTVEDKTPFRTTTNVRLRGGRGTTHPTLAIIPENTKLLVSGYEDNWGKVFYAGKEGYVSMRYLKFDEEEQKMRSDLARKVYAESQVGRIEIYGFDINGQKLFKFKMKDVLANYEYSEPSFFIGSREVLNDGLPEPQGKAAIGQNKEVVKNNTGKYGKFGDWNEFYGDLSIERRTSGGRQIWKCKAEKLNGKTKKIETNYISDSSFPKGRLSNIVIFISTRGQSPAVEIMCVNEIFVENLSKAPEVNENVPIFEQGDELIIDFQNQTVRLASDKIKNTILPHLDIGSEFFSVPVGSSQIAIASDDTGIDVDLALTKRWMI